MTELHSTGVARLLKPLHALGEALLRVADRAREKAGLPPFDAEAHDLMAALTSAFAAADDRGSVCVSLADVAERWSSTAEAAPVDADRRLRGALDAFEAAGLLRKRGDGNVALDAPLILDEGEGGLQSRLYFTRFFAEEAGLAKALLRLARQSDESMTPEMAAQVERLTGALHADEHQTKAVRLALERHFTVISGGPGTGKTTTVVLILECLLEARPDLVIHLAAPTGKATSRMRQSIVSMTQGELGVHFPRMRAVAAQSEVDEEARGVREHTIHKWLVMKTPSGDRPSKENPLRADVLIIDEASMVDIHLAARLFDAVSPDTRVIILGDKHQLAAVGPGAVFADISSSDGALADSTVELRTSRRFAPGSVIARLAAAINHDGGLSDREAAAAVRTLFEDPEAGTGEWPVMWDKTLPTGVRDWGVSDAARAWLDGHLATYVECLTAYLKAARAPGATSEALAAPARDVWEAFLAFRPLCAQRRGPQSVEGINAYADQYVRGALKAAGYLDLLNDPMHYPGLAVIIRRNDDMLGVFNGDVGIMLPDAHGDLRTFFFDTEKSLPPTLLPACDTAYAMTIHQSQGSEFTHVAVFLPTEPGSGLATRELLYTGVTRTKRSVALFGSEAVLDAAVRRRTERVSGLADRLWEAAGRSE